jgi:glycine/D-amino acid oxidase-like deaminating enzyme
MQIGQVVWDVEVTRPEFPEVSGQLDCDVCVIGLGGSGLTATLAAAQQGLNVIAIDADRLAAGAGGRNGGLLLAGIADFYHNAKEMVGHDRARKMYQATLDEMDLMQATVPDAVTRGGALRLAHDESELEDCKKHLDALIEDGFPAQWYEGPQGTGINITSDGVFHPTKRIVKLAQLASQAGARIFTHSPALSVNTGEVITPNGKINAKNILVAVDGNLHKVLPELSDKVHPVRLQMIGTAPTNEVKFEYAVYVRDGWDYWQQLPNGRVAIGGGRDLSIETEFTDVNEPTEFMRKYLIDRLDGLNVKAEIEYHWSAIVGYTHNDLPIAQIVKPNVYAVGGYCGTGNVIGALLGRAVIEKIATGHSEVFDTFASA